MARLKVRGKQGEKKREPSGQQSQGTRQERAVRAGEQVECKGEVQGRGHQEQEAGSWVSARR